jgi:hypothetical protein
VAGKSPTTIIRELWPVEFAKSDSLELRKKYEKLKEKYRKAGLENYADKADDETYEEANVDGVKFLLQRVSDKYQAAKKRIEGMTQK